MFYPEPGHKSLEMIKREGEAEEAQTHSYIESYPIKVAIKLLLGMTQCMIFISEMSNDDRVCGRLLLVEAGFVVDTEMVVAAVPPLWLLKL